MHKILVDTSFFIRLLNSQDKLHKNAKDYFKYFLEKEIELVCSTISVAEYCVKGDVSELPLKELRILPFNFFHAVKAGEFARVAYEKRSNMKLSSRSIIINDIKLFSQASYEQDISHFLTSDKECKNIYKSIKSACKIEFEVIEISTALSEVLGELPFE